MHMLNTIYYSPIKVRFYTFPINSYVNMCWSSYLNNPWPPPTPQRRINFKQKSGITRGILTGGLWWETPYRS